MTSARATNCSAPPQAISHPVRVNQIPRQIPPQPKYLRPWVREAFPCSSRNALTGRPIAGRDDPRWHPSVRYVIFANSLRLGGLTSNRAGAAFIELYFVLSSLFASRAYYAFGFLALTAAVVALTTATVTILFTYFILCAEDYRCAYPSI